MILKYTLLALIVTMPVMLKAQQQAELASFSVDVHNEEVLVRWSVGAGYTCNSVSVQRSSDSLNFETVFVYPGVCGASAYEESYAWTDRNPNLNALNFYRLNLGTLGKTHVLSVYAVDFNSDGLLTVPMPIAGGATLYFTNPDSRLHAFELFDAVGRVVYRREKIIGTQLKFESHKLPAGSYLFRLSDETGRARAGRWVLH